MREPELRSFEAYGQPVSSPVLTWLPLFAGFAAAAGISSITCPVPRPQTLSGSGALLIGTKYVVTTIVVSVVALAGVHATTSAKSNIGFRIMALRFCGVAAWFAPVLMFFAERSTWAVSMAAALAASATTLIHGYHREIEAPAKTPVFEATDIINLTEPASSSLLAMVSAALFVQLALVCAVAGRPRPASAVMSAGVALIAWFYKSAVTSAKRRPRTFTSRAFRSFSVAGLAVAFTAAGLTPYLAFESDAGDRDRWTQQVPPQERWRGRRDDQSGRQGFFQAARAILGAFLANKALHRTSDGEVREGVTERLSQAGYSVLHAMFGQEKTAPGADPRWPSKRSEKNTASIAIGGSYSGVILWPAMKDYVAIAPPLPRARIFDTHENTQKAKPLTIPFFGAYWFFRAPDGGLPADSVESRGDPASISFSTTDLTPLSMEARENFGSLIDLSCCKAIQVIITNGDRHPATVSLELTLVNTTLAGQPCQSLGKAPVNSSLHWRPADDRPPVAEILSFAVPAHSAIERFDEVVIRFELSSPRQNRSARMAIDRFRFIPRGL